MNDWKLTGIGDVSYVKSNGTVAEFRYPCSTNDDCSSFYSTLNPGYYKVEVWGAQGGGGNVYGKYRPSNSMGGYSVGVIHLDAPTLVYVFIGGKGEDGVQSLARGSKGGFNGGGSTDRDQNGDSDQAGGGGGSSDIRLYNTTVDSKIDSRIIVAGGSGGYSWAAASYNYDCPNWGGGETAGPPTYTSATNSQPPVTLKYGYQKLNGQYGSYNSWAPSGGGGGGYYGGYTYYHYCGGGGSGFVGGVIDYKDVKKKTFAGNENFYRIDGSYGKGNPGNGAARITLLGYELKLLSKIEKNYIPGSRISLDFSLSSLGVGEEATIYRSINNTSTSKIKSHEDDGKTFMFTDSFDLPFISGKYIVDYTVQSKSNTNTTLSLSILVTKSPELTILNAPKNKYTKDEPVTLEVEISDDTYATLVVQDDSSILYSSEIVCNNLLNRSVIKFNFPKGYEIGSSRNFSVHGYDQFGLYTTRFSYSYTVVSNRSPDIELSNNISYLLDSRSPILVKGNIKDYEIPSTVCLISMIDKQQNSKHGCIPIFNDDWSPFNFTLSFDALKAGIHTLSIFGIDDKQGQSNTIIHSFAFAKQFSLVQAFSCDCHSPILRMTSSCLHIIYICIDTN